MAGDTSVLKGNRTRVLGNYLPAAFQRLPLSVLDGFIVTSGNTDLIIWYRGDGGDILNIYALPTLSNLIIRNNIVIRNGGEIYNENSSPTLTKVSFVNNQAPYIDKCGGGMYNTNSSPALTYSHTQSCIAETGNIQVLLAHL